MGARKGTKKGQKCLVRAMDEPQNPCKLVQDPWKYLTWRENDDKVTIRSCIR